MVGWPGSDNMTISVQLDLTGTSTGTELGNMNRIFFFLVGQVKSRRLKLGLVDLGQVKWGKSSYLVDCY